MMRIGISGYGKMGILIRHKALSRGHEVPVVVDPHSKADEVTTRVVDSSAELLDVIIDFTEPRAVVHNIERYAKMNLTAVIGTTGWYDRMDQVARLVEESGIGLIWSGNFSLGVNIYFHLIKAAGRIMNRFAQYDVMVHEYHHRHKAESPSGTAEMIADILIKELDRKSFPVTQLPGRRIDSSELNISSTRGGSIPGTHQVIFDSEVEMIVLEHNARNRSGFAEGAVAAAEWIYGKQGLYNIEQMMKSIVGGTENE